MIRKPAHILGALGLALMLSAGSAHAEGLAQLKQFMDGTRTARGTFSQQVYSKSGRKPQQASGTFAFSRPGKFRWIYEKPYAQLLVGDGSKLWAWDQELNQVTTASALKSVPSWNFTPWRSVNVYSRPSSEISHDSASPGRSVVEPNS